MDGCFARCAATEVTIAVERGSRPAFQRRCECIAAFAIVGRCLLMPAPSAELQAAHTDDCAAGSGPPSIRAARCRFVASGGAGSRVPLRAAVDREQKPLPAGAEPVR